MYIAAFIVVSCAIISC